MGSAIAQGSLNSMHSITSYRFRKQVGIVHAAPFHDSDYLSFFKETQGRIYYMLSNKDKVDCSVTNIVVIE